MIKFLNIIFLFFIIFVRLSFGNEDNQGFPDFKTAKEWMLNDVYRDYRKTIYCQAEFNDSKMIFLDGFFSSKYADRSKKLEWEHAVPTENFGRALGVWENDSLECAGLSKRECARKTSYIFNRMEGDMHNIFPSIGSVNGMRLNYNFVAILDDDKVQTVLGCDIKIGNKKVVPPTHSRGQIARAYLYMEDTYKEYNYKMSKSQKKLMQAWDKIYPVSDWECKRDERISHLQGNHNKFVYDKCFNYLRKSE